MGGNHPAVNLWDQWFHLRDHGTTLKTELLAGTTTFLTMAYIIFVQPAVLSACGMDLGAVMVATCVSSALATLLMAVLANYPIAVAPAMGHNFFFAFSVVIGMKIPWSVALGGVAVAGFIFILTAGIGLRERLVTAIPESLQHAIAVGIGLLIAMVGLQWAGVIVASSGTLVTLGNLKSPPVLLSLFGLLLMAILFSLKIRGAGLWSMLITAAVGLLFGVIRYHGLISSPPSLAPTLLKLDILGAFKPEMIEVIFVFFFLALFDSVGTLVGVAQQAGLMKGNTLPRARQALLADAVGTVIGAGLGTSTVTAYIESATGVAAGGRTGLANLITAALFLLSLFFYPVVKMIGGGYQVTPDHTLYPVIAPSLILVGTMMMHSVRRIAWDDMTEAIPAFLTLIIMPLTVSITEGIAFGFITYALLKLVTGRGRQVHWLIYLFANLFVIRYVVLD